jgi:hypothetical protein
VPGSPAVSLGGVIQIRSSLKARKWESIWVIKTLPSANGSA